MEPYAISKKGAASIMQLMPATAVRFGVRNRFLVQENIRGGVAYLAWLKQKFNGDLRLITAAYYVGECAISSRGPSEQRTRRVECGKTAIDVVVAGPAAGELQFAKRNDFSASMAKSCSRAFAILLTIPFQLATFSRWR